MKSLGTRFLLPCGILTVLFSTFVLFRTYVATQRHMAELVSRQAELALQFNLAIREYAARQIRPITESLVDPDRFIPETMSTSFISRSIFEEVRKRFPDCIIRFASDQPRNPVNAANPEELRLIEFFRRNPQVSSLTREVRLEGRRCIAHFTPKWVTAECLRCHGDPKDAPAELLVRYGATASFHRSLGDVAGLDTVAVPLEANQAFFAAELRRQGLILGAGIAVLFGSVMVLFRLVVSRRLAAMATHFHAIASQPGVPAMTPVKATGGDEIGIVGAAFNRLLDQLRATQASLEERVWQRTGELASANQELRREVEERRRAEVALAEKTTELDRFFGITLDLLCIADTEGRFHRLNPAWERVLGYTLHELQDRRFLEFIHPDDLAATQAAVAELAAGKEVIDFVNRYRCHDGSYRWIEWRSTAYQGRLIYAAARDVTRHKESEETLRASLEEKTVLLKEVHHRVKNNLQIIVSLLGLQASQVQNPQTLAALADTRHRVRSMALLHETLYLSGNLARVNLAAYTERVCAHLLRSLGAEASRISLQTHATGVELDLDQAIPCGLILNELVSNALKHAFPAGRPGTVTVNLTVEPDQRVVLRVTDDGVGLAATEDSACPKTLGLKLVAGLARQLGGTAEFTRGPGTTCQVAFQAHAK